jgi:MoxR-like ATPase
MNQSPENIFKKKIKESKEQIEKLFNEATKAVIGQNDMIRKIILAIIANGHVLLEGVPGLAKTLAIKSISDAIHCNFNRIQFTPDLLPSDIVGTQIFDMKSQQFSTKKGPIFAHIVLADEINRAPAKVQSALLECMQEKQISIGNETFKLPPPFFVLATENPIDQEGTYPLAEAQVDRFIIKIKVDYPNKKDEKFIISTMSKQEKPIIKTVLHQKDIIELQKTADLIHVEDSIINYIVDIVHATRFPAQINKPQLQKYIQFGASPRASIALIQCARANALMKNREYVIPEDIKAVAFDVLRHRIIVSYEAEADNIQSEDIIKEVLDSVIVP